MIKTSTRQNARKYFNEALLDDTSVTYSAKEAEFTSSEIDQSGMFDEQKTKKVLLNLKAHSLKELLSKIKDTLKEKKYNPDERSWEIELSNENGFINWYYSDENYNATSEEMLDLWKQGKVRLWATGCFIHILKTVKTSEVPDDELENFAIKNNLKVNDER